MKMPPGFTLKGTLPSWPALIRAPDGSFSPPPKPSDCEPAEASFCLTTSQFATTVANGVTRTTATQVKSTCATVAGCNLRDVEETTAVEACKLTGRDIDSNDLAKATGAPEAHTLQERAVPDWSCEGPGGDYIIILNDRASAQQRNAIKGALEQRDQALKNLGKPHGHHEARSTILAYTAFFFVKSVGLKSWEFLANYQDNVSKILANITWETF
jgi:chitinase